MAKRRSSSNKENAPAVSATTTATTTKLKPPQKTAKNAIYTASDNAAMIEVLKTVRKSGASNEKAWKDAAWSKCAAILNDMLTKGGEKTAGGCRHHWQSVRTFFSFLFLSLSFLFI